MHRLLAGIAVGTVLRRRYDHVTLVAQDAITGRPAMARMPLKPDVPAGEALAVRWQRLRAAAASVGACITPGIAARYGISRTALSRLEASGTIERIAVGHYIARDELRTETDRLRALAQTYGSIVVASHRTALWLHALGERPEGIDFLIARAKRSLQPRDGVRLHTASKQIAAEDLDWVDGVLVSGVARTLVDVAIEDSVGAEALRHAVRTAIVERGVTRSALQRSAAAAPFRVRELLGYLASMADL